MRARVPRAAAAVAQHTPDAGSAAVRAQDHGNAMVFGEGAADLRPQIGELIILMRREIQVFHYENRCTMNETVALSRLRSFAKNARNEFAGVS